MGTFSRLLAFLLAFVATGASVAACSSETGDEESEGEEDLGGVSEDALTGGRRSLEINEDPSVLVEHPDTLVALEKKGLDLGSRLSGAPFANTCAPAGAATVTNAIASNRGMVIARVLSRSARARIEFHR